MLPQMTALLNFLLLHGTISFPYPSNNMFLTLLHDSIDSLLEIFSDSAKLFSRSFKLSSLIKALLMSVVLNPMSHILGFYYGTHLRVPNSVPILYLLHNNLWIQIDKSNFITSCSLVSLGFGKGWTVWSWIRASCNCGQRVTEAGTAEGYVSLSSRSIWAFPLVSLCQLDWASL